MKIKESIMKTSKMIGRKIDKHSPEILTAIGIIGMVGTVITACKATPKAIEILEERKQMREETAIDENKAVIIAKDALAVGKLYLPAIALGTASAACFIGSCNIGTRRTAAFATAYQLSEDKFKAFRAKVIEKIGEDKEKEIEDEVKQEKMVKNKAKMVDIQDSRAGDELFYDYLFDQFFVCDENTIREAEKKMWKLIQTNMYASLNDFRYEIPLKRMGIGDDLGWNCDDEPCITLSKPEEIDGRMCRVMSYTIAPRYDFRKLH